MTCPFETFFSFLKRISNFLFQKPRIFQIIVFAFFVGLGISTVYRGGISKHQRTDFAVFVRAAQAVEANQNIYDVKTVRQWNYVYLPLLAILTVPLTYIPFPMAVFLWYVFSAGAYVLVFKLAIRLGPNARDGFFAALAAALLSLPAFLNTLSRGQLGVLSVLFALGVFWLYLRKRDFLAGILLAFGIVLKTSPLAPLVFFFLFKRSWRVLAGCALGAVLFVLVIPSLPQGFSRNMFWLSEYFRITTYAVSDKGYDGLLWQQLVTPFAEDNQSAYAVLTRLKWGTEAAFIGHSNEAVRWVMRVLGGVLLFIAAAAGIKHSKRAPVKRLLLEYSLFPMVMLWVSPITQTHHYTVLYLLFLAGAFYLIETPPEDKRGRLFIHAGLLTGGFSFLAGLVSEPLAWWGVPVWGSMISLALLYPPALKTSKKDGHREQPLQLEV